MTMARPPNGSRLRGDRGSASIWAAGAIAAVLAVGTFALWLGSAAATRHRAESAADLAALAAAGGALGGQRDACGQARWVADRMRVVLRDCRLVGWEALVEVAAMPPGALAAFGPAVAQARAGPVEEPVDASRTVGRAR